jgi:glycogen synthase
MNSILPSKGLLLFLFLFLASLLLTQTSQSAPLNKCAAILSESPRQGRPLSFPNPDNGKFQNQIEAALKLTDQITASPKILIASYESGALTLEDGQIINSTFGGVGTVVEGLVKNFPSYLQKNTHEGSAGFVFPAFDVVDVSRFPVLFKTKIKIALSSFEATVYKTKSQSGADIYFIKSEIFDSLNNNGQPSPYFPDLRRINRKKVSSLRFMEYPMTLLNRVTAEIFKKESYNVYHGQDFYTALVPYYLPREQSVQTVTIHSGKKWEQGWFSKLDSGHLRDLKIKKATGKSPIVAILSDNVEDLDIDLKNASPRMPFLNFNNAFISRLASEQVSGSLGVSNGQVESFPKERKLSGFMNAVINGVDASAHASQNEGLKRLTAEEQKSGKLSLKNPQVIQAFKERDWRFANDLKTEEGRATALMARRKLKELLQLEAFGETSENTPIFSFVSRMAYQKNVGLFVDQAERIVKRGGQVILGGPVQDPMSAASVKKMENLAEKYPKQVRYFSGYVSGRLKSLIFAGTDFFVLTSRYEPCGITDMEAAWLGAIVLARRTGGLGKVASGSYYESTEPYKAKVERARFATLIDTTMIEYFSNPALIDQRRIQGLQEPFHWSDSIRDYILTYRTLGVGKQFKIIEKQALAEDWLAATTAAYLLDWSSKISPDTRDLLASWLVQKQALGFTLSNTEQIAIRVLENQNRLP